MRASAYEAPASRAACNASLQRSSMEASPRWSTVLPVEAVGDGAAPAVVPDAAPPQPARTTVAADALRKSRRVLMSRGLEGSRRIAGGASRWTRGPADNLRR